MSFEFPGCASSASGGARSIVIRLAVAAAVFGAWGAALPAWAQLTPPDPTPVPQSLKGVSVPTPSTLSSYIADRSAAIRLGKALFWDMQVGSDGRTACATCHFHAGADSRSRNQLSPGLNVRQSAGTPAPDTTFQLGGPNYQLKLSDFPTHQFANPRDRNSAVVRTTNDAVTSQGVFNETYVGTAQGRVDDVRQPVYDTVFHVGSVNTRRVEPRNTPTVINAVFNFRNFWDGRAQYLFNGVNPFGARDSSARVYKTVAGTATPVSVLIDNASLASQASGPPGSPFEMSASGRTFMDIGKRLLSLRPLALQKVSGSDSVLGNHVNPQGPGLSAADYGTMVKAAFKPEWWNAAQAIQVDAAGNRSVIPAPAQLAANQYTQMQANFSLMFGLAVQLYESTLVSDDSPFDRHLSGQGGMTSPQLSGMSVFFGKGKCASCHGGPEFTNASVRKTKHEPLQRMAMGNGGVAVYDEGFYNTAVAKTLSDIHNGDKDPYGKPISNTGYAQVAGSTAFRNVIGISPNISVSPTERIAVNGASKTSTIRNVELTAPYFHNGSAATLRQVVEFYNRGGNFASNNMADLDPDIRPLGLSDDEIANLIEFMKSLTDDRVRYHAAPFDHPQLLVPNGQTGSTAAIQDDGNGRGVDDMIEIEAVGSSGYRSFRAKTPANFLNTHFSGSPVVQLVGRLDGRCVDVLGAGTAVGLPVTFSGCGSHSNQRYQLVPADRGAYSVINVNAQLAIQVRGNSAADGGVLELAPVSPGNDAQAWHLKDVGDGYVVLYNRHNGKCMYEDGPASYGLQQSCQSISPSSHHQQFKVVTIEPTAVPANAMACADEGKNCSVPANSTATVWYGAGSRWFRKSGVRGSIACRNNVFGDPLVGAAKSCRYAVN